MPAASDTPTALPVFSWFDRSSSVSCTGATASCVVSCNPCELSVMPLPMASIASEPSASTPLSAKSIRRM